MSKNLTILDKEIKKGKSLQINLDIARLHTRTKIEVPVLIERGKKDGPVLLISAGIHGDEVNGVEIVRRVIADGINKPEAGTVICIPLLNVFGFINQERQFPDGKDLNRTFPGSKTGSLAARFAYHFMKEIVPHSDYCLDFHTGGAERFNAPQVRINRFMPDLLELAQVFNPDFVVYSKNREKTYRSNAVALGKKVLLFEGGKSLDINNKVTECGVNGVKRVMQHLGMRDFDLDLNTTPHACHVVEHSTWVRAKYSGMFHPKVEIGQFVEKNTVIGTISDPYGEFEKLSKATISGYIICLNHAPLVNQGDALAHIGMHE